MQPLHIQMFPLRSPYPDHHQHQGQEDHQNHQKDDCDAYTEEMDSKSVKAVDDYGPGIVDTEQI